MKHVYLRLTLRLMKKQKLRTLTIFCGILFSCFLLSAFGEFGYDFWHQVHEGTTERIEFDSTQFVLAALITVLLSLVTVCSVILLYNLSSLAFLQRWRCMNCLMTLGAERSSILFMMAEEIAIIYVIAAPLGQGLALLVGRWAGAKITPPLWMCGEILLWVWIISCICGAKTILEAMRKLLYLSGKVISAGKTRNRRDGNCRRSLGVTSFMARRYYRANRGRYIRMILTFIAIIVLYVPASYLINTNLHVQQHELTRKYGIQYQFVPPKL